jgi:hypothetical protein
LPHAQGSQGASTTRCSPSTTMVISIMIFDADRYERLLRPSTLSLILDHSRPWCMILLNHGVCPPLDTPPPFRNGIEEEFQSIQSGMNPEPTLPRRRKTPLSTEEGFNWPTLDGETWKGCLPPVSAINDGARDTANVFCFSVYNIYSSRLYYVVYYEPCNRPF